MLYWIAWSMVGVALLSGVMFMWHLRCFLWYRRQNKQTASQDITPALKIESADIPCQPTSLKHVSSKHIER